MVAVSVDAWRNTSTISQSFSDVGTTYDCATVNSCTLLYTLLYASIYVGFRDPNKEIARSYCYYYYYYLRPCIKCTSSELSAFILQKKKKKKEITEKISSMAV